MGAIAWKKMDRGCDDEDVYRRIYQIKSMLPNVENVSACGYPLWARFSGLTAICN